MATITHRAGRTAPGGGGARRRGGALLFTVFLISLILLLLAGSLTSVSVYQTRDRVRYEVYKDEFAACEDGINRAFAHVQFLVRNNIPNLIAAIEATPSPTLEGYAVEEFRVSRLAAGFEPVTSGQWTGLNLYRLRYGAEVRVKKQDGAAERFDHPGVTLAQNFEITYIPLFNFAIFYDPLMEIAPGPQMTVNGRVHANGDMYIQAGNSLSLLDRLTVAGGIRHGRAPNSGLATDGGQVNITDGTGLKKMQGETGASSLNNGDGWLDSRDGNWAAAATDRWKGYAKSGAHGVSPLGLPIPPVSDPHSIIDRALPVTNPSYSAALEREKLENKAGLRIIGDSSGNVKGYDSAGTVVDLRYYMSGSTAIAGPHPSNPALTKSIVSSTTFYDAREKTTVATIDINVANLKEYKTAVPSNGILYASNENQGTKRGVVRLVNGSELPVAPGTTGFSVASDDPLYVKGDYNTVNRTLAMVAADTVAILSNDWKDANSTDYSKRNAKATAANAVFINGIVPTSAAGGYSGGVENYFRFLENWSGINFTFQGSIVEMWKSQKNVGVWKTTPTYYSPPNRPWSWDTALGGIDGPPGTPRVVQILRTKWVLGAGD